MGTSNPRSPDAALKAPVKVALSIALNKLERLVHHGAEDYAATLLHEAEEPGRDDLAAAVLGNIAHAVRQHAGRGP